MKTILNVAVYPNENSIHKNLVGKKKPTIGDKISCDTSLTEDTSKDTVLVFKEK